MSREIKFRAWDKKNKSFITDDNEFKEYMIGLDGKFYRMDFYSGVSGYEDGNLIWTELKDIVLMQYTGLVDKNDKEIFEGDILKIYYEGNQRSYLKKVKWLNDRVNKGRWDALDNCVFTSCEVVGNIYENPELITEVKNG